MSDNLNIFYLLKIDYDINEENPSRIFRSMAEMIESFNSVDLMLAQTIDIEIFIKQYLEKINVGSLETWLRDLICPPVQKKIKKIEYNIENIENYFNKSKKEIIEVLDKNVNIREIKVINNLRDKITQIALDNNINDNFTYSSPDRFYLSKNIEKISKSVKLLNKKDNAYYKIQRDDTFSEINKFSTIDIDNVSSQIIDDEISTQKEVLLKIKQLDVLGDSQWIFKHNNKTITAKILDLKWLKKLHEGEIKIGSGDKIKAIIKMIEKYDKNGKPIIKHCEIIEILEFIEKIKPKDNLKF